MNDFEIKEMKEQMQGELNALNTTIYDIKKAKSTKEVFVLYMRAAHLLSDICRDKEYIISLEEGKK